MNIFADCHHPSLYYSLHLLFEERLGHVLYRPIGVDWLQLNYWKIIDLCQTEYQRQEKMAEYLIPNAQLPFYNESWNQVISYGPPFSLIAPSGNIPCQQRGLSVDEFINLDIDLYLITFNWNVPVFNYLRQTFHPGARFVVQVGNEWNLQEFAGQNVMASIIEQPHNAKNIVFYRQEFDLNVFRPTYQAPENLITSFIQAGFCPEDEKLQGALEELTGYTFRCHGKQARDGHIGETNEIASLMSRSKFGLHLKGDRDGYGHTLHNWAAIGRPIIFRSHQYNGTLGGQLLTHMETGIDADLFNPQECANFIVSISDDNYQRMCKNVRDRFAQLVNFNQDAENVRKFLERLA